MALPNTVDTGIRFPAVGQHYVGPFKSPEGNYYTFAISDASTNTLTAWKATDPEGTWAERDLGSRPVTNDSAVAESIWCYQVGDDIHIIFGSASNDKTYSRFSMKFDFWTAITGGDRDILVESPPATATESFCTIVVASDGDIYVGYNGDTEKFMGQEKERVYWDKSTDSGVTWAGPTHLRTSSSANDFVNVTAILGLSDRIHYMWIGSNDDLIHRSLSSGDVLDTEAVADSNVFFSVRPALGRGDVHTVGADQRIRFPYKDGNGRVSVIGITSGADPLFDSDTDASDNAVELDLGLCACIASRNGTAKESWLAYVHDTDRDLYVDVRDEPTEWGTDTEVHDAVDHGYVSCNVITNEAGDLVLGMIIEDDTVSGAPVQYTEHVIQAAPTALSAVDFPDQNYYVGPYQI